MFLDNSAWRWGGAIYLDGSYGTVVENCLIAFNQGGHGIEIYDTSAFTIACSNVFGNEDGGYGGSYWDQTGHNGNIAEDPQLCDSAYETLGVGDDSPCLPAYNGCGVLMGNHGAECTLTAVGAPAPPDSPPLRASTSIGSRRS